ncbi:unnamed protein product [Brassicogethes aeneus]|uniref:Uncharacterized protein n=1 Tax=Brassicogethes aeneus TaxID=1431903 RepID=A0A9P0ARY0_BRAAE|nr:unnamed protein product [Brassicogethes aeneus]
MAESVVLNILTKIFFVLALQIKKIPMHRRILGTLHIQLSENWTWVQPPYPWIGSKGLNNLALHLWSTHSTALSMCDFFLWGFIKDKVYEPQDL